MDRQTLVRRQQAASAEFEAIRKDTDQKRAAIEENEAKLLRLQGKYAELEDLIALLPEDATPQVSPAAVIKAEPASKTGGTRWNQTTQ
jgi:3-methyladenine DNA glycosylase/8-oxoguanine DNA glycosylase